MTLHSAKFPKYRELDFAKSASEINFFQSAYDDNGELKVRISRHEAKVNTWVAKGIKDTISSGLRTLVSGHPS